MQVYSLQHQRGGGTQTFLSRCLFSPWSELSFATDPDLSSTCPKFSCIMFSPLIPSSCSIRFKTLLFAYKAKNKPVPSYLKVLITHCSTLRSFQDSSGLTVSQDRKDIHQTLPRWWTELHLAVWRAESLMLFKPLLQAHGLELSYSFILSPLMSVFVFVLYEPPQQNLSLMTF